MEINNMMQENISSLQQAIGAAVMRKSMNQDAAAVASLLNGMQEASARTMELSVTPYKGGNIDVKV